MLPNHIRVTSDIAPSLKEFVNPAYSQIAVLVDENTRKYCYPMIQNSLPTHTVIKIKAGEKYKTIETCMQIWGQLTHAGYDRHALIINLGGGVIGDMGGFAAATYKRGIDFILVPTTLLSQVDASVGGKLGVDYKNYKNHIGLFQEPKVTLIAPAFLKTLPKEEWRSGYAEVIKHALIGDAHLWEEISKRSLENQNWKELITRSVKFKAQITKEDHHEKGLRKTLNFGHTVGHAVESSSMGTKTPLLHGEAVAVGMIAEAQIAFQKEYISEETLKGISRYIKSIFGKMEIGHDEQISNLMLHDKKNRENKILMTLMKPLGQAVWDVEVSEKEIQKSLAYYRSL